MAAARITDPVIDDKSLNEIVTHSSVIIITPITTPPTISVHKQIHAGINHYNTPPSRGRSELNWPR